MKTARPYIPPSTRIISDNIARWGNPLGLKPNDCSRWSAGLQIPGKGETVLYTGCEYQMTAYVQSLVDVLKKVKFQDSLFSAFSGLQAIGGRLGSGLMKAYSKVTGRESEYYQQLVRMAAQILRKLGVDFAYLDGELYSGALLYELGLFDEFEQQARKLAQQFREAGVKKVIALSPHSAEVFEQVYPLFIANFRLEVVPYIKTVAERLREQKVSLSLTQPMTVTLHDPCHLARSLRVIEEPRQVLDAISNLELREVATNRELTSCCGAPCETIFPELSECIAARRAGELAATGAGAAIVLCPFCLSNLKRGASLIEMKVEITDFIELLHKALEGGHARS
jgi:Fe-S oxidoreductase